MTALDRRITPARPDLAAAHLAGKVDAARFVEGTLMRVLEASAAVRRHPAPDAPLDTEALHGEAVTVYETDDEGWAWGQLASDFIRGLDAGQRADRRRAGVDAPRERAAHLRLSRPIHEAAAADRLVAGQHGAGCAHRGRFRHHRAGRHLRRAPRAGRGSRGGFRLRRRAVHRRPIPLGRQDQPRPRLFRPRPALAVLLRHRRPARQRHAVCVG